MWIISLLNKWNASYDYDKQDKKYKINFNTVCFDYKTGMYGNNIETYLTREEALRNKWKCEKCSERFRSNRMLHEHKVQIHSY